ncbi:MAG: hypothetical protein OEW31_08255, partial [Thermoleophilia bacterium]|nr:hypothetical protein [Thermoleophilia bacterium]
MSTSFDMTSRIFIMTSLGCVERIVLAVRSACIGAAADRRAVCPPLRGDFPEAVRGRNATRSGPLAAEEPDEAAHIHVLLERVAELR